MYPYALLKREHYLSAASQLGVDVAVIMAVAEVESAGGGFLDNSDLPKILFEGHCFHKYTGGRYSRDHPALSYPAWTTKYYKGGRGEYDRLLEAIKIHDRNPEPALMSTSWGKFQIMGFNHQLCGYDTVGEFVNAMAMGEDAHLKAFVTYIVKRGLAADLKSREWADFARAYNGPQYQRNAYDKKLAAAFSRKRQTLQEEDSGAGLSPERGDLMGIQSALNQALGDQLPTKLVVDGWIGEKTRRAIRQFNASNGGNPDDSRITRELGDALGVDLSAYVES
jgi:hypothetical protein